MKKMKNLFLLLSFATFALIYLNFADVLASVPNPCDSCVWTEDTGNILFSCKDKDGSNCGMSTQDGFTLSCANRVKCN